MDQIKKWMIVDGALIVSLVFVWFLRRLTVANVVDYLSSWIVLAFIVTFILLFWVACIIIWKVIGFVVRKLCKNKNLFVKVPRAELFVISLILVIFYGMTNTCMCGSRSKARDARRMSDMRQIVLAQEAYFDKAGKYYQAESMPTLIPVALSADVNSFTLPLDPESGKYYWIDNTADGTKFCTFATLENINTGAVGCRSGCKYYTASQSGNFFKPGKPEDLSDCISGN
jgi:hypothetical protein